MRKREPCGECWQYMLPVQPLCSPRIYCHITICHYGPKHTASSKQYTPSTRISHRVCYGLLMPSYFLMDTMTLARAPLRSTALQLFTAWHPQVEKKPNYTIVLIPNHQKHPSLYLICKQCFELKENRQINYLIASLVNKQINEQNGEKGNKMTKVQSDQF